MGFLGKGRRETALRRHEASRRASTLVQPRHPFAEIFLFLFPALLLPLFLVSLSGCGRKIAPEPPIRVLPARVEPVRLSQEGSDVVLRFPYPSKTNGGETLTNLTEVTVYRELIGAVEGQRPPEMPKDAPSREREEKGFRSRAEKIQVLTRADMDAATVGSDLVVRDPLVPLFRQGRLGRVFLRYGVTATRDRRKLSELSPLVAILPRVPPDRPYRVLFTVEETRVCLDWSAPVAMLDGTLPVKVAGYAIYRRDAADEAYEDRPLGVALGTTSYVDTTVVPDRNYAYTVRAAPVAELPLILGPPADEVAVSTKDVFPPPAPEGVLVLAESGGTRLVWNPSLAADIAGYRVYRLEKGAWTRIADGLKDPVYFDAGVPGSAYGVTAVDASGNESPMGTAK